MYFVFFIGYYRCLKRVWNQVGDRVVAPVTTLLYFLFLLFNIGMRSGIESAVMAFIIPTIPEIILSEKTLKDAEVQ